MLATERIQGHKLNQRTQPGVRRAPVKIRKIRLSDLNLVQEMHERLSKDSIYYRYLGTHKPSTDNLAKLCSSNGGTTRVLVATVVDPIEKVVAIAYYQKNPENPSTAEPAVLVEDSYQGMGLGRMILQALYQKALQDGLKTFDTFIEPNNFRVVKLIRSSGLQFDCKYCDGLKQIRVWLGSAT